MGSVRSARSCCASPTTAGHLFRRKPTDPNVPDVPDERPGAEAQLAEHQQVERMYAAIRELPLGMRQVLTLALEELPHAEIAEVLGIKTENVAVRLTRARQALRDMLAGPVKPHPPTPSPSAVGKGSQVAGERKVTP